MAAKIKTSIATKAEKQMLDIINNLCYNRDVWWVWSDFITATACAISNSTDKDDVRNKSREEEYAKILERLGNAEDLAKLFATMVEALEENPEQDLLGNLFMKLNLTSHWRGQFFTPYCVCKTMAAINSSFLEDEIDDKGWVSVNDPACGAGATLIATANTLKEHNINYQNHALFVGQDISRIAGLMCYIQISLLGCAGYVVVADTLHNPITSKNALFPYTNDNQEIWVTPMYFSSVWDGRRRWNFLDMFLADFMR